MAVGVCLAPEREATLRNVELRADRDGNKSARSLMLPQSRSGSGWGMRNIARPVAFIIAPTNHGTLTVNRNDYRIVDNDRGYGVGC